ncbi:unnamed protein product, partial [Tenebrio molitor]
DGSKNLADWRSSGRAREHPEWSPPHTLVEAVNPDASSFPSTRGGRTTFFYRWRVVQLYLISGEVRGIRSLDSWHNDSNKQAEIIMRLSKKRSRSGYFSIKDSGGCLIWDFMAYFCSNSHQQPPDLIQRLKSC